MERKYCDKKAWGRGPKRDRIVGIIVPGNWEEIYVYQSRDTKMIKASVLLAFVKKGESLIFVS